MALQLVHITDKGEVRSSNQDSFCARISSFGQETVALLVVCDGVGGLQSGELASTGAVRCFEDWFEQQLPQIMGSELTETTVFLSWHQMLENLHNTLCEYAERSAMQFGTTVSALLISSDRLYWVQVGDSRIYLDDGTGTEQLTKDQTLAMREVEAGRLSPEAMQTDQRKNILLQCLGYGKMEPVFQSRPRPQRGAVALCSDGFCHYLEEKQIRRLLTETETREQLWQQMQKTVEYCRAHGETDNITALVLKWDGQEQKRSDSAEWIEVWARLSGEAAPEEYDRELGGIL